MAKKVIFPDAAAIPEMTPSELYLPPDRTDIRVIQAEAVTAKTTTPREVSYAFWTGSFKFDPIKQIIEICQSENIPAAGLVEDWGSHIGRTIMRVLLEPDRLAPIDMPTAYDNELITRSNQLSDPGERSFFESFVDLHGVIERV